MIRKARWAIALGCVLGCASGGAGLIHAHSVDGNEESYRLSLSGEGTIELEAWWQPVREWAMSAGDVATNETLLAVKPAERKRSYSAEDFAPFLPDEPVHVGEVWEVERDAVLRFLTQFHAGASSSLHHEPVAIPGSWACLRAIGERYAEIITRSHAQFVLEGDIHYTPAQFEGRLLLDRQTGAVAAYRLVLPDRNTNLDVNVPTEETRKMGNNFGMPGIGWIPRMELLGPVAPEELAWTESISDESARKILRERYYGAIDWLPFEEAVRLAEETGKLLHVVVILGTLDDESC